MKIKDFVRASSLRTFIGLTLVVLLIVSVHNPIVFLHKDTILIDNVPPLTSKSSDTLNLLDNIDFTNGEYSAYLIIIDDYALSSEMPKGKVLKTEDVCLLSEMKKDFLFLNTNSDIATVENKLLIFERDSLIFISGIVIDNNLEGLQNSKTGFIRSVNKNGLSKHLKYFKRVYTPIILL